MHTLSFLELWRHIMMVENRIAPLCSVPEVFISLLLMIKLPQAENQCMCARIK